jgi:predicted ATP-dependent endonuclease of OLD family
MRLTQVSTRGVPGLPDVDVRLSPVTALVGPRGAGKSRLLAAIAWLLRGHPHLTADGRAAPYVAADVDSVAAQRRVERGRGSSPDQPLPTVTYLTARDRLAPLEAGGGGGTNAGQADALVEVIERRCRERTTGEVLLIEEPELMLTPQAQRYLYRQLRTYAELNQVIYSTRSPGLVDPIYHQEIVRLDRTRAGFGIRRAPRAIMSDEDRLRLAAEFDRERGEMFFATAVVLVEGQTERQSLPLIFRALGHDPDALGISITEVGGKGNLTLAARLLRELRIPHLIVFDADTGQPGEESNAVIRSSARGAPTFALEPDFEAVAGIHSHEDKVLHAWRRFHDARPAEVPAEFRRIVATAIRLARVEEPY